MSTTRDTPIRWAGGAPRTTFDPSARIGVHIVRMKPSRRSWMDKATRVARDPTLHFFALGAMLILVHRLVAGDPRTIVITPALKADLLRRFHDQLGRDPSRAEADAYLQLWKADEALYREALREGIDRNDPTVRNVLIAKMRERALLETRIPEPTESDLQQFLEERRAFFEAPLIYEHEFIAFDKRQPDAEQKREIAASKLNTGATIESLGLRSVAANVNRQRIEQEFGPEAAAEVCRLPVGQWVPIDTADRLLLVRMIRIEGGLPSPEVLHERLVAGWKASVGQKLLDAATKRITERYRFEEPTR